MNREKVVSIKIFVDAGEAKGGPPLGPILGQYQIDINSFCKEFNEKTSKMVKGVPLPVILVRFENKTFKIFIKKPTISFIYNQISGNSKSITVCQLYDVIRIFAAMHNINDLKKIARICFGNLYSMKVNIIM